MFQIVCRIFADFVRMAFRIAACRIVDDFLWMEVGTAADFMKIVCRLLSSRGD